LSEEKTASRRPEYLGDPTIAAVARRPQWLLALLLALVVAGVFAWLGRWQMDNAIRTDIIETAEFETLQPLTDVAAAGEAVMEAAAGAVVDTAGTFNGRDLEIVAPRENGGELGAWVTGHLVTDEGSHLAVAIGWAADPALAESAAAELAATPGFTAPLELEGRFMPTEGIDVPAPGEDHSLITNMAPAQLVNLWSEVDGPTYAGYLVLHPEGDSAQLLDSAGLEAIDSVAPEPPEAVNWLNVFYAIEWVVFAGFAVFLWYRLVRDAWEKEHELKLLQEKAQEAEE